MLDGSNVSSVVNDVTSVAVHREFSLHQGTIANVTYVYRFLQITYDTFEAQGNE